MIIQTNRNLYLAIPYGIRSVIAKLIQEQKLTNRSLEEYLRSLWLLASEHQAVAGFSPAEFFEILARAFSASVPPFEEIWRQRCNEDNETYLINRPGKGRSCARLLTCGRWRSRAVGRTRPG